MMKKLLGSEKPRLVFRFSLICWPITDQFPLDQFENRTKHQTLSFKVEGNVLQYADDVVIYDKLRIAKPMRPGLYTVNAFIKPKAGFHYFH